MEPYNRVMLEIRHANETTAELLGTLTPEKIAAGAPLNYRFADGEEMAICKALHIPCHNSPDFYYGWVHPMAYDLITTFYEHDGFSGLTLYEWLQKTWVE